VAVTASQAIFGNNCWFTNAMEKHVTAAIRNCDEVCKGNELLTTVRPVKPSKSQSLNSLLEIKYFSISKPDLHSRRADR
jgi:hypothetical protein